MGLGQNIRGIFCRTSPDSNNDITGWSFPPPAWRTNGNVGWLTSRGHIAHCYRIEPQLSCLPTRLAACRSSHVDDAL